MNEDLTREDGVIQCRHVTTAELVQEGWRIARAVKILLDFIG